MYIKKCTQNESECIFIFNRMKGLLLRLSVMIVVVDVFALEIHMKLVEFLENTITEVGKDTYHSDSSNTCDDLLIIHGLPPAMLGYSQARFHRKDLLQHCLPYQVR